MSFILLLIQYALLAKCTLSFLKYEFSKKFGLAIQGEHAFTEQIYRLSVQDGFRSDVRQRCSSMEFEERKSEARIAAIGARLCLCGDDSGF
jgi:hypothetical protein